MTGTGLRISAKKHWALVVVIVVELTLIAYLVAEAFRADAEWRLWYLLGAGGLSLIVGPMIWSRCRQHASR